MSGEAIRVATREDNPRLIELERACPQGTSLRIYSEREDYFYRSFLYGNQHTLVAEDRIQGRLIGVMAGTLKEVLLDGRPVRAAYFYDLRLHPDYRRTVLGRHMLGVWNRMDRWARESGAQLIYGTVKGDNEIMLALQQKKKDYRFAGRLRIVGRPVYRSRSLRRLPEEVDLSRDGEELTAGVFRRYGRHQLFPTLFRDRYLSPNMEASGLFSCFRLREGDSYASLGLFRICRTMRTRVLQLPVSYRLAKPLLAAASRLLPLPRIPAEGGTISYCHVFNHLVEGPRGLSLWRELLAHANNLALAEGATLLTSAFDAGDPLLPVFDRGAINRIEYLVGYKSFRPDVPETLRPYFPDVRDMN